MNATAQGLNDFMVFGTVAVTAVGSGALHYALGWDAINLVMAPFIAAGLLLVFRLHRRNV